jgi:hypothetical protein
MNTRFRRPLQAAALLFSLSLFVGYLWSTQRQSGLPILSTLQPANHTASAAVTVITMGVNSDGTKRPIVLGTKSMGGTPVVHIDLTPEEQVEHAEMLKPFLESSTVLDISEDITFDPSTITGEEDYISAPKGISPMAPMFMPGSKSISQPVFSSRKAQTPARTQAQAPALVIPGSKSGRLELIPPPKADIPSMSATPPEQRAP